MVVSAPALQLLCSWPELVAAVAPPLRWSEVEPAPVLSPHLEMWLTNISIIVNRTVVITHRTSSHAVNNIITLKTRDVAMDTLWHVIKTIYTYHTV